MILKPSKYALSLLDPTDQVIFFHVWQKPMSFQGTPSTNEALQSYLKKIKEAMESQQFASHSFLTRLPHRFRFNLVAFKNFVFATITTITRENELGICDNAYSLKNQSSTLNFVIRQMKLTKSSRTTDGRTLIHHPLIEDCPDSHESSSSLNEKTLTFNCGNYRIELKGHCSPIALHHPADGDNISKRFKDTIFGFLFPSIGNANDVTVLDSTSSIYTEFPKAQNKCFDWVYRVYCLPRTLNYLQEVSGKCPTEEANILAIFSNLKRTFRNHLCQSRWIAFFAAATEIAAICVKYNRIQAFKTELINFAKAIPSSFFKKNENSFFDNLSLDTSSSTVNTPASNEPKRKAATKKLQMENLFLDPEPVSIHDDLPHNKIQATEMTLQDGIWDFVRVKLLCEDSMNLEHSMF